MVCRLCLRTFFLVGNMKKFKKIAETILFKKFFCTFVRRTVK